MITMSVARNEVRERLRPGPCLSDAIEFAAHPAAVSAARLRTRRALRAWGLDELSADAEQVVSELTANAVEAHHREHLAAPVRLTLLAGLRTLLIVVRDASPTPPSPTLLTDDGESGRGLIIVDVLASAWNWKPAPGGGKTVRAFLRGHRQP